MHSALNFSQRYAKQKINLAYPYMITFALAVKKKKKKQIPLKNQKNIVITTQTHKIPVDPKFVL